MLTHVERTVRDHRELCCRMKDEQSLTLSPSIRMIESEILVYSIRLAQSSILLQKGG